MTEADRDALSQLGISADVTLPTESTIRRTLAGLDADDLDRRVGAWMATRVGQVAGRRVLAIDGKSLRGAKADGAMPHLLAALDHDHRVVLGQRPRHRDDPRGALTWRGHIRKRPQQTFSPERC